MTNFKDECLNQCEKDFFPKFHSCGLSEKCFRIWSTLENPKQFLILVPHLLLEKNGKALESFVWIWPSQRNFPEFQMGLGFWCSQHTTSQQLFKQWGESRYKFATVFVCKIFKLNSKSKTLIDFLQNKFEYNVLHYVHANMVANLKNSVLPTSHKIEQLLYRFYWGLKSRTLTVSFSPNSKFKICQICLDLKFWFI